MIKLSDHRGEHSDGGQQHHSRGQPSDNPQVGGQRKLPHYLWIPRQKHHEDHDRTRYNAVEHGRPEQRLDRIQVDKIQKKTHKAGDTDR